MGLLVVLVVKAGLDIRKSSRRARDERRGLLAGMRPRPQAARLKIAVSDTARALVISAVKGTFERSGTRSDAQGGPTRGPMREHTTREPAVTPRVKSTAQIVAEGEAGGEEVAA